MGEGDGTPAERVATGNGWVSGVCLGDEILQRCDKDVPVDVMLEEVETDLIPNNANTIFGSSSQNLVLYQVRFLLY